MPEREQRRARIGRGWEAQQLLCAVLHKKQSGHDAQHAQHAGCPNRFKVMNSLESPACRLSEDRLRRLLGGAQRPS